VRTASACKRHHDWPRLEKHFAVGETSHNSVRTE